jgi:hypothetical protein
MKLLFNLTPSTRKRKSDLGRHFPRFVGGGSNLFTWDELSPYLLNTDYLVGPNYQFKFSSHIAHELASDLQSTNSSLVMTNIPLSDLVTNFVVSDLKCIAQAHGISIHSKMRKQEIQNTIRNHACTDCHSFISAFEIVDELEKTMKNKTKNLEAVKKH